MKFRSKEVVEAVCFRPEMDPWPAGVERRLGVELYWYRGDPDDVVALVPSPRGWTVVKSGYWIVYRGWRWLSVYSPERFAKLFEPEERP